jgi:hypothetical protein
MDTLSNLDIEKTVARLPRVRKRFAGCFSSDNIPTGLHPPYGMVVNLDVSSGRGTHWVGIFVPNETTVEYFDSLGASPPAGSGIESFVARFPHKHIYSRSLQSPLSSVCGHYALYFVVHRLLNVSAERALRLRAAAADEHVRRFYHLLRV